MPTARWGLTTGIVFARKDLYSAEHDIIIYDQMDYPPVHDAGEFLVVPAQSVRGIIEVKSRSNVKEFKLVCDNIVGTARMCREENNNRIYTVALWYDCWRPDALLRRIEEKFANQQKSEAHDLPNAFVALQFAHKSSDDYVVLSDIANECLQGGFFEFTGWPAYCCYRSSGQAIRVLVGGFHELVSPRPRTDQPLEEQLRADYTGQYWRASAAGMEPQGFVFTCAEELANGGAKTYFPMLAYETGWQYKGKFGNFVR